MEPPPRELPPDDPAHEEFYLWCAALREHGHPPPVGGTSAEQEAMAFLVTQGVERIRATGGARSPVSVEPPTVQVTAPTKTASDRPRRRPLAIIGGAVVLGAVAAGLWQLGLPVALTGRSSSDAPSSPSVPDIAVSDIARLANRTPPNADSEPQAQRADNITHAGEALAASGDLPEALRLFRQGLAIRRELAARDPGNVARQHALAASWTKVADLLKLQGDTTRALGSYRAAEAIEQACARAQPGNVDFQRELFFDAVSIGEVLLAQNDPAGALEAFRRGSEVQRKLCARDPSNTAWQGDLAVSLRRVADAFDLSGDVDGALQGYRDALAIHESLAARDPSNTDWQHDVAAAVWKIGDLLLARNETDAALRRYDTALALMQKLVDLDGTATDWQQELAAVHDRVGQAFEAKKRPDEALPPYRQALSIAEHLAAADSTDRPLQSLVASVSYHLARATMHCETADVPAVRHALETTRDFLTRLRSAEGVNFPREQAEMLSDAERLLARLDR